MVFTDINESNFIFNYDNLTLYFSSELYLEKFKREYKKYLKEETMRFKLRYKCNIFCDVMLLLLLYKKIEKRGFKALYNGQRIREDYYFINELDFVSFER